MSFRNLLKFINLVFLIYFSNCFNLFYHPSKVDYYSPKKVKISYEDIYFKTQDGILLNAYYIPVSNKTKERKNLLIVYFHGNAQNISAHYLSVYWLTKFGYDLLVWDYRGFGNSEGEVHHKKNFEDMQEMIEFSISFKKENKIILWGQSLGGALLITSFANSKFKEHSDILMLIIDGTFDQYSKIIDYHSDLFCLIPFRVFVKNLYQDSYSPIHYIDQIHKPIIFIYGSQDFIVPWEMGYNLFLKANTPKVFLLVDRGGHSNWTHFGTSPTSKKILEILTFIESYSKNTKEFITLPFIE
ncbi:MAG: alpha/beta hydrolase [Leptonema sp. (in: bacteria)]